MGMMNKMRESTGAILWILVFSFGGLWVLQDSGALDAIGVTTTRNVATVDGEPIDIEQYQAAVQQRTDLYQQQDVEMTPALQARIEDEVFEALVDNRLREAEMERLGVEVSDAEVEAAFTGPNPDPLVRQYFGNGQGGVDQNALRQFVQEAPPEQVRALEEQIRQNRRQAKLDALIQATARVTEGEIDAQYVRRNRRATAQLVALRYADVPDAEVEVTDRDLRSYYDAHRDDFERPTTYDVEFVSFAKVPSAEDSARVREELARLRPALAAAEDPAAYVATTAYGTGLAQTPPGDIAPEIATALYRDLTPGRVVGPILAGEEGVVLRITGSAPAVNGPFSHARHILFPLDQLERANQLKAQIASGEISFAQAARQYSTDTSNKDRGGELGWFGPGVMVAPFEAAVVGAPLGQVVGPVETQFGHHLVLVEQRTDQVVETVGLSVPLTGSFDRLVEQAEDLQYYAEADGGGFAEEAGRRGLAVETAVVRDNEPLVPGVQIGRDAVRWMRRASEGDISPSFDAGDRYVVFHLTERLEEGFRPFDEVRAEVEPRVLLEKKEAVSVARLREALAAGGDLAAVAARAGTTVQPLSDLTLASPIVAGVGHEPALVGTAFGLDEGQTSGAVAGDNAAFVVRVTGFAGGDPAAMPEAERTQTREQLLQRKRQEILETWMQGLRDNAEIEDNRDALL